MSSINHYEVALIIHSLIFENKKSRRHCFRGKGIEITYFTFVFSMSSFWNWSEIQMTRFDELMNVKEIVKRVTKVDKTYS